MQASRAEVSVIVLVFTLLLAVGALLIQSQRVSRDVTDRAFVNAENLVNFVSTAHRNYSDMVGDIPLSQMTAEPDVDTEAIWLPVTFANAYVSDYSAANPEVDFRLYSRDPFRFRQDRVLDAFAEDALDALVPGGPTQYRAIEDLGNGYQKVRLASAFVMTGKCVACHNDPKWGLQKRDWKAGDVRGLWEASIIVRPPAIYSQTEFVILFAFVLLACVLSGFVVWPAVRSEVRTRSYLKEHSHMLEQSVQLNLQKANTDPLTNIGNRRMFDQALDSMIDDARTQKTSLSVILFDIDHFKKVNDTFGHACGDQVIRTVADIMRGNARKEDVVARIGGEEFVILLPELSQRSVLDVAERIKSQLQRQKFIADSKKFDVTISGGVAHFNSSDDASTFLNRADQLLYQAKLSGRNQIHTE